MHLYECACGRGTVRGKAKRMGCSFLPASSDCTAGPLLDSGPGSLNPCTQVDRGLTVQWVLGLHSPRHTDLEGGRAVLGPVLGSGPASLTDWLARSEPVLLLVV